MHFGNSNNLVIIYTQLITTTNLWVAYSNDLVCERSLETEAVFGWGASWHGWKAKINLLQKHKGKKSCNTASLVHRFLSKCLGNFCIN